MKNLLKKLLYWIKSIFDSKSPVSSKRVAGILIILWALIFGSYYVYTMLNNPMQDIGLTKNMIEVFLFSGVSLLAGGTLVEGIKSNLKDKNKN